MSRTSTTTRPTETPAAKRIRQLADLRHLLLDVANGEGALWHQGQLERWCAGHSTVLTRIIGELKALEAPTSTAAAKMYPANWPRCPGCGEPALDGHITCGNVACNEGAHRNGGGR